MDAIKDDDMIDYYTLSIAYTTANESHKALVYVKLKSIEQRGLGQAEIIIKYRKAFKSIQSMALAVEKIPPINTGGSNAPVQIVITGDNLEKLSEISQQVSQMLGTFDGAVDIDSDYQDGKPEITISVIRHNTAKLGITATQIAALLNANYSSESKISDFSQKGREYDITLRFNDKSRANIDNIKKLQIRAANGEYVFLDGLIRFEQSSSIATINRFDRVIVSCEINLVPAADRSLCVADNAQSAREYLYTLV